MQDLLSRIAPVNLRNGQKDTLLFEKLPADIHFEIFKLILPVSSPIEISRHRDKKASKAPIRKLVFVLGAEIRPGPPQLSRSEHKCSYGAVHSTAMLHVSRLLHAEARAVLLGQNKFVFDNPLALKLFTEVIGEGFKFLTNITVKLFKLNVHTDVFDHLSYPNKLRCVEIIIERAGMHYFDAAKLIWAGIVTPIFTKPCGACGNRFMCICITPKDRKRRLDGVILRGDKY